MTTWRVSMAKNSLAVDIGATKAAIAIVNNELKIIDQISVPTGTKDGIWEDIALATQQLISKNNLSIEAIGIGSAGPIDVTAGTISPVNITSWRDFPIVEKFRALLNVQRIELCGDAIALTIAESKIGAGKGISNFLGMVVSTGIGGGLVLSGEVFKGQTGNAGYFGHHSINFQSEICRCGRNGCVEYFASGPSMVRIAKELGWSNSVENFESLAADAKSGNQFAIQSIDSGAHALAVGIINVLAVLDIDTVIVGGGVTKAGAIYWDALKSHVFNEGKRVGFIKQVDLRRSELNADAGLIGAALQVMGSN